MAPLTFESAKLVLARNSEEHLLPHHSLCEFHLYVDDYGGRHGPASISAEDRGTEGCVGGLWALR